MSNLLDYDPNVDGILEEGGVLQHFGVKGMRWGVRRERNRGQRIRKTLTTSDRLGRNEDATAVKTTIAKANKAAAMANYEEHIKVHEADTANKLSKMKSGKKALMELYDEHTDYVTKQGHAEFNKKARGKSDAEAKAISDKVMAKTNKKIAEIQAEKKEMAADYDNAIKKYKAKREKQAAEIRTEMAEQGKEWDASVAKIQSQNTGKSISQGKAVVNSMLTGNPDGRVTKTTVAQYAVAAAIVGAMVYDYKK